MQDRCPVKMQLVDSAIGEEEDETDKIGRGKSRKQTEKKRRDRFNALLHELAEAITSEPVAKLDKITLLRHIVNFFRKHEVRNKTAGSMCPPCLTSGEFNKIALDCQDWFVLVLDRSGSILFASDDSLPCVGFVPIQLVGSNFFKLVHDDDKRSVYSQLMKQQHVRTKARSPSNVHFSCKIHTGAYKRSSDCFESVRCHGEVYGEKTSCLVMLVKLDQFPGPNKTLSCSDTNPEMFSTKLDLKWRYTSIDETTTSVLGYLPSEITGRSEYELVHQDDLNKLMKYHEVLLHAGRVTTCYYRLLTKAHCWIWVRTSCCVSYSQWNCKPDCVTCVSVAVGYSEVCLRYNEVLKDDVEKFKRFRVRTIKREATEQNVQETESSSPVGWNHRPVGFSNEGLKFRSPSGLSSMQMLVHLNLRERYTKLSRKMSSYVHEMKVLQRKMGLQESLTKESAKQAHEKIPEIKQQRLELSGAEVESHDGRQLQQMAQSELADPKGQEIEVEKQSCKQDRTALLEGSPQVASQVLRCQPAQEQQCTATEEDLEPAMSDQLIQLQKEHGQRQSQAQQQLQQQQQQQQHLLQQQLQQQQQQQQLQHLQQREKQQQLLHLLQQQLQQQQQQQQQQLHCLQQQQQQQQQQGRPIGQQVRNARPQEQTTSMRLQQNVRLQQSYSLHKQSDDQGSLSLAMSYPSAHEQLREKQQQQQSPKQLPQQQQQLKQQHQQQQHQQLHQQLQQQQLKQQHYQQLQLEQLQQQQPFLDEATWTFQQQQVEQQQLLMLLQRRQHLQEEQAILQVQLNQSGRQRSPRQERPSPQTSQLQPATWHQSPPLWLSEGHEQARPDSQMRKGTPTLSDGRFVHSVSPCQPASPMELLQREVSVSQISSDADSLDTFSDCSSPFDTSPQHQGFFQNLDSLIDFNTSTFDQRGTLFQGGFLDEF